MKRHVLSPAAQRDLDEIWDYTEATWSDAQAERYITGIRDAIRSLCTGDTQGRSAEHIRPRYRRLTVESHVIYYRDLPGIIDVVRILHQRMDVLTHLSRDD